jgi:hypothetical protein
MSPRTAPAVVAFAVAVLLLSGCSNGDPRIADLRSDRLMTEAVSPLTETQLFGQVEFTSLGKHQPATLTRLLKTGTRTVTNEDLAVAADAARADGWRLERVGKGSRWRGTKTVQGQPVDIVIRRSFSSTEGMLIALVLTDQT